MRRPDGINYVESSIAGAAALAASGFGIPAVTTDPQLVELIALGEQLTHRMDQIISGRSYDKLHFGEIQGWIKAAQQWAAETGASIPEQEHDLNVVGVYSDDYARKYTSLLTKCLRVYASLEFANQNTSLRSGKGPIFISYVRENSGDVERLRDDLSLTGNLVWLDRDAIMPGMLWKEAVRKAIQNGMFFIACFSKEYTTKKRTVANEELVLAIDEIRLRSDSTWFIPVKISPCEIPDRDIGGGRRLSDYQWISLYDDWEEGIERLNEIVQTIPVSLKTRLRLLRSSFDSDRSAAAEQLYLNPDGRAAVALLRALYDPGVGVSYWIVQALGRIRHPRVTSALVRALDDPYWPGQHTSLLRW